MAALPVLNMRTGTTWILAAAALLAALALTWEEESTHEATDQIRLLAAPESVTAITINRPDESVTLTKDGHLWQITAPIQAVADTRRVEALLTTLANPGEIRVLEGAAANPQEFGLNPPRATIQMAAGNRELRAITLGRATPVGKRAYIQQQENPAILVVSDNIPFATDRGTSDLRSRKLLPRGFAPLEFRLRRPNLPEIALRATDRGWEILAPYNASADTAAVARWIEAVEELEASSFFDQPEAEDLIAYSLQPAPLEIEWIDREGRGKLRLGGPNLRAGDDELWMQNEEFAALYSVPRAQVAKIDITPETLRDKTLLSLKPEEVHAVVLQRVGQSDLRLERQGTGWLAGGTPANTDTVEDYLAATLGLSGERTLSTAGGLEHFGLDRPAVVLIFEGSSGQTLARLLATDDSGRTTITREGSSRIYLLPQPQQPLLTRQSKDFR